MIIQERKKIEKTEAEEAGRLKDELWWEFSGVEFTIHHTFFFIKGYNYNAFKSVSMIV